MTVLSCMALQCHTGNVHEQGSGFQKKSRVQQGPILSLAFNFLRRLVLAFPESDRFYTFVTVYLRQYLREFISKHAI